KFLRRQRAHGREQRIGGDVLVALALHQSDLRVEQLLLGVQNIERRARADLRLLNDALISDLVGVHLLLIGGDRGARGAEIFPCLGDALLGIAQRLVAEQPILAGSVLGLADRGVFAAGLVDRNSHLAGERILIA